MNKSICSYGIELELYEVD